MKYYNIPIKMSKTKITSNTKGQLACTATGILIHLLVGILNSTTTPERVWQFIKRLNVRLTYDPTFSLLFSPRNKNLCTHAHKQYINGNTNFIFIIAKNWEQLMYPSIQVKRQILPHSYNEILLSNKNKLIIYKTTWMISKILC